MTPPTIDGNESDVYSIQQVNARRAGRAPAVGGPGRANGNINIGSGVGRIGGRAIGPGGTQPPPDITPPPEDGGGGNMNQGGGSY